MQIGLGILVHNEMVGLIRAINSVKNYVDKIYVGVDSRTNDGTIKYLEVNNIPYFVFDICHGLSLHYNALKNNLNTDWILILDADEMLLESNAAKLKDVISKQSINDVEGIALIRNNWENLNMNKKNTDNPSDYIFRLFKNKKSINFIGRYNCIPANLKKIQFIDSIQVEHFYSLKSAEVKHDRRKFKTQMENLECNESLNVIKEQIYNKNMIKANLI